LGLSWVKIVLKTEVMKDERIYEPQINGVNLFDLGDLGDLV